MSMTASPLVYYGTLIHSKSLNDFEVIHNGLIIVSAEGIITALHHSVAINDIDRLIEQAGFWTEEVEITYLKRGEFICPGFVDTHNHAPQWTQRGTGRGIIIMDWLYNTTFPHEARFEDPVYAKKTYTSCVNGFLNMGVTTASYYGSKHGEATKILADVCLEKGQRALVGKCNMNRNAPDWYRDLTTEHSLEETKDFIKHVKEIDPNYELVTPIITPRFAVACTDDLLSGLGEIAKDNSDLPIQTHFDETPQEMEITKSLFPKFKNEADLYEHFNLLNERSILAHCIYVNEYEMDRLKALKCGVAHCPVSNATTGEFGVAHIRDYLRRGIKVGLGTDSGGGFSSSILEVIRMAFIISNARQSATKGEDHFLTLKECFFLATLGGAQVCSLDDKIGNFVIGKEFDALEIHTIDTGSSNVITPIEDKDTSEDIWEKFIMTGDDRNIVKVFVSGRQVK